MQVNETIVRPLRDSDKSIIVHQGGTSSGKTYGILQHLLIAGAENENEIITIVAEDIPNLKAGAYRDMQAILSDSEFLQYYYPEHNKSDRIFRSITGSVIEFKSFSDEIDARSGKRTRLFVNEANGVKYGIYEQLALRTTEQVIVDFNPSARFWAHDNLEGRDDVEWIITTYRDNAFLHENIRKKILSYEPTPENIERGTANEYRWMVYGLGQVGRLEGLVFPDWKVGQFPNEYKWRIFGLDFGFTNDPTAFVEIRYAHGALYWKQHIYETGLTNPDIATRLDVLGMDKRDLIIADSVEPKSIEEIKRRGWNIKPAIKGQDSITQGIDAIKRYKVFIEPKSKDLIEEFSSYTWGTDKDGNYTNKPIDSYNHCIDAGRYALTSKLLRDRQPMKMSMVDF